MDPKEQGLSAPEANAAEQEKNKQQKKKDDIEEIMTRAKAVLNKTVNDGGPTFGEVILRYRDVRNEYEAMMRATGSKEAPDGLHIAGKPEK